MSLPFYGFQDLSVGYEQVLLTPPCLMGFSLHQHVIHGSLVCHPWESRVNPARPCSREPCITPLFSTISNIPLLGLFFSFFLFFFFSKIFVCGLFRLSLSPLGKGPRTSHHLRRIPLRALIPLVGWINTLGSFLE